MIHAYCFLITFYRELYDFNMSLFGKLMKCGEVIGLFLYFSIIFECLEYWTIWKVFEGDLNFISNSIALRHKYN